MTASATRPETPRTALASALDAPKRPEIQGLRTIAVLLVVLYHLWPSTFSGGYIGVDIFFVISGFLITSHLLREVDATGRVDLARFWARRARRLLPGAYLVLAATAIGIYVWVPRLRWPQFFNEIIASTLYYENWSLAHDAVDYLAESNAASPVQHYWTLSAEEQFYLGWPLLMLLGLFIASRFGARRRVAIAAVLGAVVCGSLVYSLHLTSADSARAYFITPTRAWEFGFGAMLAFVPTTALSRVPTARRAVASWAAITVMIGAGFVFDGATPMPGTGAIVVVVAATAFLAAGGPTQWWAPLAVLDRRAVQFTGEISYALYLWRTGRSSSCCRTRRGTRTTTAPSPASSPWRSSWPQHRPFSSRTRSAPAGPCEFGYPP
jgi:peptidoglycan/LPS O-acetylase OafA/YrhL